MLRSVHAIAMQLTKKLTVAFPHPDHQSELVWAGQAAQGGGIKCGGYKAMHLGLVSTTAGCEVAR